MGKPPRWIEQLWDGKLPRAGTKAAEIIRHRKLMLAVAEVMAEHGCDHEHIANMLFALEACGYGEVNVSRQKRESPTVAGGKLTKGDAAFLSACGVKAD